MLPARSMPPWMFKLQGTVQGFVGNLDKPKSIVLEVEQEPITIKLPKEIRASLQQHLQPGDRVSCIGRSQIDYETSVVKLEAYKFFALPPDSETPSSPATPRTSLDLDSLTQVPCSQPLSKASSLQCSKILICKKSGCKKRGGSQLVAALEQILRDRQLQDKVKIQYSGCQKRCSKAPSLTILPSQKSYDRLNLKTLSALIDKHFCLS